MNLIDLVILCLGVWRITVLIHEDKITERFRQWLGEKEINDLVTYPDTFLGNLISCFRCVSVWSALITLILWELSPFFVYLFALSAAAVLINKWYD